MVSYTLILDLLKQIKCTKFILQIFIDLTEFIRNEWSVHKTVILACRKGKIKYFMLTFANLKNIKSNTKHIYSILASRTERVLSPLQNIQVNVQFSNTRSYTHMSKPMQTKNTLLQSSQKNF